MMDKDEKEHLAREIIERTLWMVRSEYTVMPRFGFHQPLDYHKDTLPPDFDEPIMIEGEPLPLPPVPERMGYSSDDIDYLSWGKEDKNIIKGQIANHVSSTDNLSILDFGCSSGRVLRHFYSESVTQGWELFGVDIQARPIQWMRVHFPANFCVFTGNTMPHLPLPDASIDVIYGVSVFTHIKYLWDAWLLELRRVLKPNGLLIQTIHSEHAWKFYYDHRNEDWVKDNQSSSVLQSADMGYDFLYYGDAVVSQVFWRRDIAKEYWSRYFDVIDILPPPSARSFQDWMICRKS